MRAYEEETEFAPELGEFEDGEYGEFELEDGEYGEFEDGELGEDEFEEELEEEMEQFLDELQELTGEYSSPLSEEEELELAEELLEVSSEEELDHFIGGLLTKAVGRLVTAPGVRKVVSGGFNSLRGMLRGAPKKAMERRGTSYQRLVARHDRGRVGAERRRHFTRRQQKRRAQLTQWDPRYAERRAGVESRLQGLPALQRRAGYRHLRRAETSDWRDYRRRGEHPVKRLGRKAAPWFGWGIPASMAATALYPPVEGVLRNIFEVDPEGMSLEEAEFEAARRFVRLSAAAARNLAAARRRARPRAAARAALLAASRRYAPGMYRRFPLYVRPAVRYVDYGPEEPPAFPDEPAAYQDDAATFQDEPTAFPDEPQPAGSNGRPARRPASGRWMRRGNRIVITGL